MRRNGKAAVLIVATLYAAGCARSDYWLSQQERQSWRQIEDRRIAQAKDAPPPKILPDTFIAAAQLYETQHDFRKALVMYDKAIASCAGYARAYHRKGLLLSAMTRYEASEECLRLAVEFKPENARIRNDYAFALMILNDWTAAELELRRAIELDPDLNRAYINLGMTLCQLDRFREGLSAFCKALPNTDARYNLGLMLRGKQRYREAANAFETVLALDPSFSAAKVQLAELQPKLQPVEPLVPQEYYAERPDTSADEPDNRQAQRFNYPKVQRGWGKAPRADKMPYEVLANEWRCIEELQAAQYGFSEEPFFDREGQLVQACEADPFPEFGYAVTFSSNEGWNESYRFVLAEEEPQTAVELDLGTKPTTPTMAATIVEPEVGEFSEADPPPANESISDEWLHDLMLQIMSPADQPEPDPCEEENLVPDDIQQNQTHGDARSNREEVGQKASGFPKTVAGHQPQTEQAILAARVAETDLPEHAIPTQAETAGPVVANRAQATPTPANVATPDRMQKLDVALSITQNERRCLEDEAIRMETQVAQASALHEEAEAWWNTTVAISSPADDYSTAPIEPVVANVPDTAVAKAEPVQTNESETSLFVESLASKTTRVMPIDHEPSPLEPWRPAMHLVKDTKVDWSELEYGPPSQLQDRARATMAASVLLGPAMNNEPTKVKNKTNRQQRDVQSCDEQGDQVTVFPILGPRQHEGPAQ